MKRRSKTKPGSLLRSQIPVRTFADWNEKAPGFIEIDLVEHSGGVARGIYAQTFKKSTPYKKNDSCYVEQKKSKPGFGLHSFSVQEIQNCLFLK